MIQLITILSKRSQLKFQVNWRTIFKFTQDFFPNVTWRGYFRHKRYVKSLNIGKIIASYKYHSVCIITRNLLGKSKENSDVKCKYGFLVYYFSYYSLPKNWSNANNFIPQESLFFSPVTNKVKLKFLLIVFGLENHNQFDRSIFLSVLFWACSFGNLVQYLCKLELTLRNF